jgi:hypothetical protein
VAAERGIPLRQFVTEAVQEKLRIAPQEKPGRKHLGKLKHPRKERKQIEERVEEAFEQIDHDSESQHQLRDKIGLSSGGGVHLPAQMSA